MKITELTNSELASLPEVVELKDGRFCYESSKDGCVEVSIILDDTIFSKKQLIPIFVQPGDSILILIDTVGVLYTFKERMHFFVLNASGQQIYYQ